MNKVELNEAEYKAERLARFNARRIAQNKAAKLESEPKRHRRPVKSKPISADDIDFSSL